MAIVKRLIPILLMIAAGVSPILPVKADFSVSNITRSDLTWNNQFVGTSCSESKVSPSGAAFQSGSVVYGGNDPNFYTSLMANLGSGSQATTDFLNNFKITVKITDSNGALLSPGRIGNLGMLLSPSNQTNDWANELHELYNFLASVLGTGVPVPTLPNGSPPPTGTGSDSSSVYAQWSRIGWSSIAGRGLDFRYQPDFPSPGVYSVSVTTHAEVWVTTSSGNSGFLTSADSSYSFQYVYENDANSGNDAGKTFSTATGIALGSYSGFSYGADNLDMYKFDAFAGTTLYYSEVPPASANFAVAIYDSNWNYVTGSNAGTGLVNYGSFTPTTTGSWFLKVYTISGSGTYSLTLSNHPVPPDFTISSIPASLYICPGTGQQFAITLRSVNGYQGTVSLSYSYSPSSQYISASFSSSVLSIPSGGSVGTFFQVYATDTDFAQNSYSFVLTATGGSLSHSLQLPVWVNYGYCTGTGGGGGSVASGTLIVLADGSQVPVQQLQMGMQLLSYDITTRQFETSTITRFFSVVTENQMVIDTSAGKPLIVDQNPMQKLYVMFPDGTWTLLSVTELRVGYSLFNALTQTWVPITEIHYQNGGRHVMYDIYTTAPYNYIANGYLDPPKL